MQIFGLRLNVILIVFLLVFLAIFSVRVIITHFIVNKPLDTLLTNANLESYTYEKDRLELVWDGENPQKIIDLLENKPIQKRFVEAILVLEVKENQELWQDAELIIREGLANKEYYTALSRLRAIDSKAQMVILNDYLYVQFLGEGQLYLLTEAPLRPRLISKVVAKS